MLQDLGADSADVRLSFSVREPADLIILHFPAASSKDLTGFVALSYCATSRIEALAG